MRRLLLLLPALVLALAVFAACDDDNDDNGDDDGATPVATEAPDEGAAAPDTDDDDATPEPADDGDAPENGDAIDDEELIELAADLTGATFNVTWDMDATIEGEPFSGEWTWIQDGAERQRIEIEGVLDGMSGTITMIMDGDTSYMCAEGQCLAFPSIQDGMDDPSADLTEFFGNLDEEVGDANIRDAGTRDVAGVEARCYEVEEAGDTGTVCFSDEGVPMYMEMETDEGTMFMEATSYSDSVSDSDFEPPYDVMEMP